MKRVMLIIFSVLLICSFCSCSTNTNSEFTPKNSGVVVYPDQETANTVNGYLKVEEPEEPNTNIGQPQYDGSIFSQTGYYVNINSKKFHYPDCRYAQKMNSSSLRKESDYNKLINEGFTPCKVCKP